MVSTIKRFFINITSNYIYILWFIYNLNLSLYIFNPVVMFCANFVPSLYPVTRFLTTKYMTLLVVTIMYILSIAVALSPMGEKFLRFLENIRRLETKKEKEYLIPLFVEVRKSVPSTFKNKIKGIKICVIDAMYINAYALGKRTIAVTTGAVESLLEDELKGLIAHEIGHIVYGHSIAILLSNVANGIFMIPIITLKMVINAIEILHSKYNKRGGLMELIIFIIKTIFNTALFLFVYIGEFILSINSRSNEYQADNFAYDIGYGTNLIEALYLIQGMLISDKMNLWEKLKRSHPHIAKRIGRLEKFVYEK